MVNTDKLLEKLNEEREQMVDIVLDALEKSKENNLKLAEGIEKIQESIAVIKNAFIQLREEHIKALEQIKVFQEALEQIGFGDLPDVDNSIRMKHIARRALKNQDKEKDVSFSKFLDLFFEEGEENE